MGDGRQKLRVQAPDARELLRVDAVVFLLGAEDDRQLAGIGDDHFVLQLLHRPTYPRRMSSRLNDDA